MPYNSNLGKRMRQITVTLFDGDGFSRHRWRKHQDISRVLIGIQWKHTAAQTRATAIPHIVQRRMRRRPMRSTSTRFTQVKMKFVAANTSVYSRRDSHIPCMCILPAKGFSLCLRKCVVIFSTLCRPYRSFKQTGNYLRCAQILHRRGALLVLLRF